MSKYNVVIRTGRLRWFFHVIVLLLLVSSVWSLQPNIVAYQPALQVCLALLLCAAYGYSNLNYARHSRQCMVCSSSGEVKFIQAGDESSWQISQRSNLSSLCLWIELTAIYPVQKSRRFCLFRDELSQQDFRRLSRVILRCKKHPVSANANEINRL